MPTHSTMALLDHVEQLKRNEKQARAEVLVAVQVWRRRLLAAWANDSRAYMTALLEGGLDLQPAAADLEEHDKQIQLELLASFLRRIDLSLIEGYAATTTPAYNEALTDLRDGYMKDFKPVVKDLEALLEEARREAELEMLKRIRTDEGGVYVYCPERENTEGPAIIRLDVFIRVKKRQIAELEKARAEGKG